VKITYYGCYIQCFVGKDFAFSRMLDHFSKCNWAIEINNEFTFVEATYAIFDLGHDFPLSLIDFWAQKLLDFSTMDEG
jgi:hypothetical protein